MSTSTQSIIALAIAGLMSVSCGMSSLVVAPTTSLDSDNYVYVSAFSEDVTNTYVFGIGGMKSRNPLQQLLAKANLKAGEALANISVLTHVRCILGIVTTKTTTVTAQKVRFIDGSVGNAAPVGVVSENTSSSSVVAVEQTVASEEEPNEFELPQERKEELDALIASQKNVLGAYKNYLVEAEAAIKAGDKKAAVDNYASGKYLYENGEILHRQYLDEQMEELETAIFIM